MESGEWEKPRHGLRKELHAQEWGVHAQEIFFRKRPQLLDLRPRKGDMAGGEALEVKKSRMAEVVLGKSTHIPESAKSAE